MPEAETTETRRVWTSTVDLAGPDLGWTVGPSMLVFQCLCLHVESRDPGAALGSAPAVPAGLSCARVPGEQVETLQGWPGQSPGAPTPSSVTPGAPERHL